jgi:hypothetical protein
MAKILDTHTGQVAEVPDDVAKAQIVKSDRYQDVSSGKVEVQDSSGTRGTVALEDLKHAAAAGMRILPGAVLEDERLQQEYGNQGLKANAEALARGLTVGISDEVLTGTGLVAPEALRERQERNAGTTISELAGAVAPALIPGAGEATLSGQVARLGGAVSKEVAATSLGRAVTAGAVEGGLFGLGGLLTEHSMGKADLTAEKAVAALGTGALLGAGTGALVEKGSQKLAKVLRRVDEAAATEGASMAENVAEQAPAEAAAAPEGTPPQAPLTAAPESVPPPPEAPAGTSAPEAPPPPPGGPEASPSPGTAPAGTPPPETPPEPVDAGDAANAAFANARAVKERVQKVAEENPGFFRRLFEAFDVPFPDADGFVLRGLDAKKGNLKKLRLSGLLRDAPAELRADPRFKGLPGDERWAQGVKTGEDAAELVQQKLQEQQAKYSKALDRLDSARTAEEGIDGFELARRIQRNVLEPLRAGPAAAEPTAQAVEAEIQKLLARADEQGKVPLRAAEDVKRSFDPWAKFNSTSSPAEASKAQAFRDMREQVKKAVEEHADAISKRIGGRDALDFREAKRSMQKMYALHEIATDRLADAKGANRVFSLTDNIGGFAAGAIGGGFTPAGIATGLGVALLNKWGRENLPWILARALTKYDESAGVRLAAKALRQLVQATDEKAGALARTEQGAGSALARVEPPGPSALTRLDRRLPGAAGAEAATAEAATATGAAPGAPRLLADANPQHPFGKWAETLRRAAHLGDRELWLTHVVLSKDPDYRQALASVGGVDFSPDGDQRATKRAAALEALGSVTSTFDKRVDSAVSAFLAGSPKPMKVVAPTEALRKAEALTTLSASPEALTTAISRELGSIPEHAPATAEGMSAVLARAVGFLASKAPKAPEQPMDIPALRKPFRPADSEVARFARYLAAVENPAGVLDDMAAGTVTREAVEALQQVYPSLWGEVQGKLLERLASAGTQLDYKKRLALAQVLGPQAVDVAASPQAVARFQDNFSAPEEQGSASPRPPADGKVSRRIQAEQSPGDRRAFR